MRSKCESGVQRWPQPGVRSRGLTGSSVCLQYMLSQQTIDALRKPAFDVWLWESNEVRFTNIVLPAFLLSRLLFAVVSLLCICLDCTWVCVQYHLSKETIDALRQPIFDVWQWEPNEVRPGRALNIYCSLMFKPSSINQRLNFLFHTKEELSFRKFLWSYFSLKYTIHRAPYETIKTNI